MSAQLRVPRAPASLPRPAAAALLVTVPTAPPRQLSTSAAALRRPAPPRPWFRRREDGGQLHRTCPAASASSAAAGGEGALSQSQAFLRVVGPTALALMLCNMDRICLSIAILPMSAEFGWPASLQGLIQSAFLWGYMATQLLGGAIADAAGGKAAMAAGVAWFSAASMLLPAALSSGLVAAGATVPVVCAARCAVGLGEGFALPSMNNLIASYIAPSAKARALGLAFTGFHCGNLLGLLLSPFLLAHLGWRGLFYVFGAMGGPLLALWWLAVPSRRRQQASEAATAAAAAAPVAPPPPNKDAAAAPPSPAQRSASGGVLRFLWHPATWAIIIVNFVNHWGYFLYLSWMPTYFNTVLGYDLRSSSLMAFLPWLAMASGSAAAGLLADGLMAAGWRTVHVRKAVQSVAFLVPAASMLLLAQPRISPALGVAAMTAALGVTSLGQAGFVANMSDLAPRHAGKMFGLCNTFGSAAGILGVTATGYIVERCRSFAPVFLITAAMYVFAVVVYNLLATGDKVFD